MKQNRMVDPPKPEKPPRKPTAAGSVLQRVAQGWRSMMRHNSVLGLIERNLPFTIFLTFVAGFYIWTSHTAEKQARRADHLQKEIRELKTEFMVLNASVSQSRQQSQVARAVDTLGLAPLQKPPYKLAVPAKH